MFLRVCHNQALLRNDVFEIVHDIGRELVVRLELPTLREHLGCGILGQITCDLLARRFQQVAIFVGQRLR